MKLHRCKYCGSNAIDEIISKNKVVYKCYTCGKIANHAASLDSRLKTDITKDNKIYHFLAALVVKNHEGKILISQRRVFPHTWAILFGHMHYGENFKQAAKRELMEEAGILKNKMNPLFTAMGNNPCRTGVNNHLISAFEVKLGPEETVIPNNESQEIRWVTSTELKSSKYHPLSPGTTIVLKKIGWL